MEHKHGVYDSDTRFVINPITRQIKNDSSKKTVLMQGDHNSESFTFELPRYIEGHDMSLCNQVEVHYLNSAAKDKESFRKGLYTVDDLQISPDDPEKVVCSWLISQNATQLVGKLSFRLRFKCVEDGVITYAWHTAINADISVSDGINADETFEMDYVDIIEQWKFALAKEITDEVNAEVTAWKEVESGKVRGEMTSFSAQWNDALNVERKRIDQFVALPEGATTNDAEVADARIDYEGYAYSNLGAAMRTQIRDIADNVGALYAIGDNLIDPEAMIDGYFVNQTAGTIHQASTHRVTPFLRVLPNTVYFLDSFMNSDLQESDTSKRYALYDADRAFISGGVDVRSFTTPENAKYIRVSVSGNYVVMLQSLGETKYYIPYSKRIAEGLYESGCAEVFEKHFSEMVDASANLFNPLDVTGGYYVNQTTGELLENRNHISSDFLKIKANTAYTFGFSENGKYVSEHHEFRYALYDKNRRFITGGYKSFSFTAPSMAKYIRISYYHTAPDVMFCEGTELPEYVDFKCSLKPYLVDGYTKDEIKALFGVDQDFPFNLPDVVYGLVGEELNIYFDNLVDGHDSDYLFNVTCSVGRQMERCYRVTPTETGEYTLKIDVIRKQDNATISKSATLKIADKTASVDSVSVLVIGDSTTANGICVDKLVENFAGDAMTLKMLGTRGKAPAMHEGRSGWTFNQFANVGTDANVSSLTNAFYNPNEGVFDMAYYLSNCNIETPDVVIINLGINDCFSHLTDDDLSAAIAEIDTNCEIMMNSIRAACPDAKICVALTIPPNYSQDAFGKGYSCGQTQWRYKRNNVLWVKHLIDLYDNREDENIFVVPIHTNLDTIYNMGMEETKHNKRNESTCLSPIGNGGVHPVDSGYWQIADVYWFFLKNIIS